MSIDSIADYLRCVHCHRREERCLCAHGQGQAGQELDSVRDRRSNRGKRDLYGCVHRPLTRLESIRADGQGLTGRIFRRLGAMGYVEEAGTDEYELTNFPRAMTVPIFGDGYVGV